MSDGPEGPSVEPAAASPEVVEAAATGAADAAEETVNDIELSVADVGAFLLKKGYALTALELFQEAKEAGVAEQDMQCLSKEFAPKGEDAAQKDSHTYKPGKVEFGTEKEKDEYLSLLEYELRIAREDLEAERQKVEALSAAGHSSFTGSGRMTQQGQQPKQRAQEQSQEKEQKPEENVDAQQGEGEEAKEDADADEKKEEEKKPPEVPWQSILRAKRRAAHSAAIVADAGRAEGRVADTVRGLRDLGGEAGMVELVAESLPNIVRGVVMSKRDEVVPLLLETILRHHDEETRTALIKLLLTLLRQPDEPQRAILVEAIAVLAELMGPEQASAELVPQIVQDCASKYEERRILVATACGAIARFVTPETRAKTLRNVCVQMVNDRNDLVRRAAVRALAHLVTLFEREDAALLMPLEEEFYHLLDDRSEVVVEAALGSLLVALVDFADITDQLAALSVKLATQATAQFAQIFTVDSNFEKKDRATQDARTASTEHIFKCLNLCVPRLCEHILISAPGSKAPKCIAAASEGADAAPTDLGGLAWISRDEKEGYISEFSSYVRGHTLEQLLATTSDDEDSTKKSIAWIARELIPSLYRVAEKVPSCDCSAIDGITNVVRQFANELGEAFHNGVVNAVIRKRLSELSATAPERPRLLVLWLAAAAGIQQDPEIRQCFFDIISEMAQDGRPWTMAHMPALRHAADLLSQTGYGSHQSLILRVLSELSSSPSVKIRAITAALYSGVVPHISAESTKLSVFSVLAALHTDPDATVRRETCQVFVVIMQCFPHDKDLCERTSAALDMLAQDQNVIVRIALCQAILRCSAQFNSVIFFARLFFLTHRLLCALLLFSLCIVKQTSQRNSVALHTQYAAWIRALIRVHWVWRHGKLFRHSNLS